MHDLIFLKALKTKPFLALIFTYMMFNWGVQTLMFSGTMYLSEVYGMSIFEVTVYCFIQVS